MYIQSAVLGWLFLVFIDECLLFYTVGVMDLLGGTGGLVEFKASLLASHGFAALALAYFGYDDLPSSTSPYVELDYIEEAAKWLYQHPKVLPGGIALHSHCMGTWLALLLASYRTDLVKAVVAVEPWYFALQNTAYRYKGKLSNTYYNFAAEAVKYTDQGIILRFCFSTFKETANPSADLPALTPVENILCPILLVYSTEDLNMNPKLTSQYIYDRLKAVNKDSLCTMLRLPGAGHMVDPPHSPLCYSSYSSFFKVQVVWGGQPKSHAMGQVIYWDKSLQFMQEHLMRYVKSSL